VTRTVALCVLTGNRLIESARVEGARVDDPDGNHLGRRKICSHSGLRWLSSAPP
jgi:hypothetical protein